MKFTKVISSLIMIFIPCFIIAEGYAKSTKSDFIEKNFMDKDVCFYMVDMDTGKTLQEFNDKRCAQKFVPCSTFKLSLAAMAFDSGYFKSPNQAIKWDGTKHSRKSVNQDQTPKRFLEYSVNWVGDRVVKHLGVKRVKGYLTKFGFGSIDIKPKNNSSDISHGLLKLSALEQVGFIQKLWEGKFISAKALAKVKESTEVEITKNYRLYGKTGTGCIDSGCMSKAGRQLGWFIGVLEHKSKRYAFAANYSDLKPSRGYAGPKAKKVVRKFFKKFYL